VCQIQYIHIVYLVRDFVFANLQWPRRIGNSRNGLHYFSQSINQSTGLFLWQLNADTLADISLHTVCSAVLQLAASTSNMKHQKAIIEMLLLAGALPNFSSRIFSYVGPSLSPLVEYLTYCENYDYTLIRLLLQYGARVNFRLPTRLLKIRHPAGVLGQVNTLTSQRNYFILRLNWKYDPTNRRCSDIGFRVSYRVCTRRPIGMAVTIWPTDMQPIYCIS